MSRNYYSWVDSDSYIDCGFKEYIDYSLLHSNSARNDYESKIVATGNQAAFDAIVDMIDDHFSNI